MKALNFMAPRCVFIEIGQSSLKVLDANDGLELPLERLESGRLTSSCKERLISALQSFFKKKESWIQRPRAFCAIGARGVSLRRLTLPASSKEELQRLLVLQIENEFPLAPDELAWGYCPVDKEHFSQTGGTPGQELIVVAVKKEVIEEYSEILSRCGLIPIFTLGVLARSAICPQPPRSYAVLDIGRSHSELISFVDGAPTAVRILRWGGEDITRSIEKKLGISRDEAEKLKIHLDQTSVSNDEVGQKIRTALEAELDLLAALIQRDWIGQKLYLTGKSSRLKEMGPSLARALQGRVECERIELMPGEGRSAAILGLKRYFEENGGGPPLIIQIKRTKGVENMAQPTQWKWAALAVLLAFSLLSLRYVEPFLQKPRLARKLSQVKAYRQRLPKIDKELSFLQFLKTNQSPYLDAVWAIANSAAPGTRVESLSITRHGDLSLRGMMQNSQQATDFRTKLIDSGLFATVVVDEQTPTPDRQRVTVRITAQWKQLDSRTSLAKSESLTEVKNEKPSPDVKGEAPGDRGPAPEVIRTSAPRPEVKR